VAGPVEYIVVGESGTVRILDLLFIGKDAEGDVVALEVDELGDELDFGSLDGEVGGLISPEDIAYAAAALEPNSSAALLVWEDLWAAPFVQALRNANGVLLEGGRIPQDLIEAALTGLSG
jgi:Family of unknown function (DUF6325)